MAHEHRPVSREGLHTVGTLGERLAERLRVVDKSVDLIRLDRLDHAIGVLRQGLNLRDDRLDTLAQLGQIFQRHVDIGSIIGQSLGEDVGVLKR